MWRQFLLLNGLVGSHTQMMRCWLRDDPRLRVGVVITLKDDSEERNWVIDERSEMTLNRPPTKEWKVGGLS